MNYSSPFFSIIIPTFNREKHILGTINSVLNQTFNDFELLIIDNHSNDLTKSIVLNVKDPRINFYQNEKNFERCYSRNRGIDIARGQYILFLDSDDYFEQNHLENWYLQIKTQNYSSFFVCRKKIMQSKIISHENLLIDDYDNNIFHFFLKYPIVPGQVCIYKDLLIKTKFNSDYLIFEDTALWLQLSLISKPIFVGFNSFIYTVHDDNSVNWQSNNYGIIRLKSIKKFFNDNQNFSEIIDKNQINILISNTCFTICKYHIYNDKTLKSIYFLFLSLFIYPSTYQLKHRLYVFIKLILFMDVKEYKN